MNFYQAVEETGVFFKHGFLPDFVVLHNSFEVVHDDGFASEERDLVEGVEVHDSSFLFGAGGVGRGGNLGNRIFNFLGDFFFLFNFVLLLWFSWGLVGLSEQIFLLIVLHSKTVYI